MSKITLAIPTENEQGDRSAHFGHCPLFTLFDVENDQAGNIRTVENIAHGAGGCMKPVAVLAEQGVKAMVSAGMGPGPFLKMQKLGMEVYFADLSNYPDVQSAMEGFIKGKLPRFTQGQLCTGSGNCH